MCVNLKTFNESFRKWAEEREEEGSYYSAPETVTYEEVEKELLLADLDRKKLIATDREFNRQTTINLDENNSN